MPVNNISGGSTTPLHTSSTTSSSSSESQPTTQPHTRPPVGGPLGALQNRGGQSTPLDRREGVTNEAGRYAEQQGATYYSAAVQGVSTVLQNNRLGITQQSHDSVLGNLDGIAQGKQTHTGAHMTESLSFGKDAIKHFQNGELRDGVVTAAGSALNAAASLTFGPGRDLQTALQHRDPKVRVDAMASLHQDFAMLSDFTKEHD